MNFYSSTTSREFIEWLRDSAIKGGMPPRGKADLDRMVADAKKEMYRAVCHAIEVQGAKKAALSAEQIHKVINHILWGVRP